MASKRILQSLDYLAIVVMMCMSIGIGVFYAVRDRKRTTIENYFLARRKSFALPTALSYVATFQSSILFLGLPAEGYLYGITYIFAIVGVILAQIFIVIVIIPFLHPLRLKSINEYFSLRFESNVLRVGVGCTTIFTNLVYVSVVLLGSTLAFQFMSGVESWIVRLAFAFIVILYTSVGGLKAVIWADVLQACVSFLSVGLILVSGVVQTDGIDNVVRLSAERLTTIDYSVDPSHRQTALFLVLYFFILIAGAPMSPLGFQRIASLPNTKAALKSFFISSVIYTIVFVLALFQGLVAFAYFAHKRCDPIASGQIRNMNNIIPQFVLELFHNVPGGCGIIVAGLLSASMSTMSSCLSGISYTVVEDVLKTFRPAISDRSATVVAKVTVALAGALSVVLAQAMSTLNIPLHQVIGTLSSSLFGPFLAVFVIPAVYKRTTVAGVLSGFFIGTSLSCWISYGRIFTDVKLITQTLPPGPTDLCPTGHSNGVSPLNRTAVEEMSVYGHQVYENATVANIGDATTPTDFLKTIYSISYLLPVVIGLIVAVVVMLLVSCLTSRGDIEVDEKLLFRQLRTKRAQRKSSEDESGDCRPESKEVDTPML